MLLGFTVLFVSLFHHSAADHDVNSNLNEGGEKSGYFVEEDMMSQDAAQAAAKSPRGSNGRRVLQALKDEKNRWPQNTLSYAFDGVSSANRQLVRNALGDLQRSLGGCIRFVEDGRPFHVRVQSPWFDLFTCTSKTGFHGWSGGKNNQPLTLGAARCFDSGTIQHEFLHALGLGHTHQRGDRDTYVEAPAYGRDYEKYAYTRVQITPHTHKTIYDNFGIPYDYDSIMHYPGLRTKGNSRINNRRVGNRVGASTGDIRLVQRMYRCRETGARGSVKGGNPQSGFRGGSTNGPREINLVDSFLTAASNFFR